MQYSLYSTYTKYTTNINVNLNTTHNKNTQLIKILIQTFTQLTKAYIFAQLRNPAAESTVPPWNSGIEPRVCSLPGTSHTPPAS